MATASTNGSDDRWTRIIRQFERIIVVTLIVMMMVIVALATLDLGWIIVDHIMTPPVMLLEPHELLDLFGFVLFILIGVELLETIKAYVKDSVIHVESVLEVALIALARKIIVLDWSKYDGLTILSIGALIVALAAALALKRHARPRADAPARA